MVTLYVSCDSLISLHFMSIYKIDKLPNCQDDMVPLERKKEKLHYDYCFI